MYFELFIVLGRYFGYPLVDFVNVRLYYFDPLTLLWFLVLLVLLLLLFTVVGSGVLILFEQD